MHDNDDLAEPDLDALTRGELAELDGPAATVAGILDEWLHRLHGITSGQHGAGLFLDLLAAEGWRVERIQVPPWPFATPVGPVTVHYWAAAPTPEQAEAAKQAVLETAVALYDEQQPTPSRVPTVTVGQEFTPEHRYVLRAYRQAHGQPTVTAGMPTAVEVNGAVTWWNQRQAPTVEVVTGEPNSALYFVCQSRHPLAVRTTTILENGERRGGRHEIVCPACEADGVTEVRLPDLDDEADDD